MTSHPSAKPDPIVLLVTGGSRGIGGATALAAGRRGYAVAVNYLENHEAAQRLVEAIRRDGGTAEAFAADVGDRQAVTDLFQKIDERMGPVGALVNNAAWPGPRTAILDLDPAQWEHVFRATLFGAFHCIQAAVERMARSRGGRGGAIVSVGSEAARFGGDRLAAYAAAKAGIHAMTLGLGRELAPEGIRINAVSPGVIATEGHRALPPEQRQRLETSIPLRRMGEPEEVAEAILWLLSDAASYVTGTVLPIAGGR